MSRAALVRLNIASGRGSDTSAYLRHILLVLTASLPGVQLACTRHPPSEPLRNPPQSQLTTRDSFPDPERHESCGTGQLCAFLSALQAQVGAGGRGGGESIIGRSGCWHLNLDTGPVALVHSCIWDAQLLRAFASAPVFPLDVSLCTATGWDPSPPRSPAPPLLSIVGVLTRDDSPGRKRGRVGSGKENVGCF
ncbi:hypothetical protein FB451DRAFT_1415093 [Mycena latifolia]|nr:hypothetical protein FB451DRAFT_1415093 [Mycena latifolia]